MTTSDGVFLFIATYENEAEARMDYDVVRELHHDDAIGSFDAAVVTKDRQGKVHVNKDETATRGGIWKGVAAGALVGLLFPPTILASAAVAGAAGGIAGHLWKGMSRNDVKELGELIDEGQAALVVLGDVTVTVYPGARHEILNEITKGKVLDDLVAWLDSRLVGAV